jgi:hypothetical protein
MFHLTIQGYKAEPTCHTYRNAPDFASSNKLSFYVPVEKRRVYPTVSTNLHDHQPHCSVTNHVSAKSGILARVDLRQGMMDR